MLRRKFIAFRVVENFGLECSLVELVGQQEVTGRDEMVLFEASKETTRELIHF